MKTMEIGDKTGNVLANDFGRLPRTISRTIALPIDRLLEL
jgi:hypothetical protein